MVRISTPAIVCALSMASLIARTVQSMLATMPLRRPRHGTVPTPRMVVPSAPSTSATTAQTFVVPMSRPTTISPCEAAVLILRGNRTPLGTWPTFYRSKTRGPSASVALTKRASVAEERLALARCRDGGAKERVRREEPHAAIPAEHGVRRVGVHLLGLLEEPEGVLERGDGAVGFAALGVRLGRPLPG